MRSRSVRANSAERTRALPGDALIAEPLGVVTHALTIRRLPPDVWPWLAQMGAGRAGWYSYDFIDNGRQPSALELLPQFQTVSVGTLMPALPGVTDAFIVVAVEPERSLVLAWPSPHDTYFTTWAFVLEQLEGDEADGAQRSRPAREPRSLSPVFGSLR